MKKLIFLFSILSLSLFISTDNGYFQNSFAQQTNGEFLKEQLEKSKENPNKAIVIVFSDAQWSGFIQDSDLDRFSVDGAGTEAFPFDCTSNGSWSLTFQKGTEGGTLAVLVIQNGENVDGGNTKAKYGVLSLSDRCAPGQMQSAGGGCLIATATYGSELAPQVQQLRELRDNKLLQTETGTSFMKSFNEFYYSFSPTIADYERESPLFKEAVKITITPLLTSLSILNYVDMETDAEVLGYGISLILLNIGMYFVAPVIIIMRFKK